MSEPEKICVKCMASDVANHVLSEFTDMHPKVKMSYDQWMSLGILIEETIKEALGVPPEEVDTAEKVVIQ